MSSNMISFNNASDRTIWVTVESERAVLTAESTSEMHARTVARSGGGKIGVKIPKKVGIELGGEGATSNSSVDELVRDRTYDVVQAPIAGETRIPACKAGEVAVPSDTSSRYFLSVRDEAEFYSYRTAQDVGQHDYVELTTAGSGLYVNVNGARPVTVAQEIRHRDLITLELGDARRRYVGSPVIAKNWPAGAVSDSAAPHYILGVDGVNGEPLNSGAIVRLQSEGNGNLYCSDKGWIYYDKWSSNPKQLWKIKTVGVRSGPVREGDRVILSNENWKDAQLRHDGEWLSCTGDGPEFTFIIGKF